MLEIKNLDVETSQSGKRILKNINLKFEKGKIYVLMGRNGSGKSTLANVIMGSPKYKITNGKILLEGEDITNFSPDEKAKKGIFLSFQFPTEIPGVSISNFLRTSFNILNKNKISFLDFQKRIKENSKLLEVDEKLFSRYLNEGFSGGEKKKMEILQMLTLNPKFTILDETDSGLDKDSLKKISEAINNFMDDEKCLLIITHHEKILDHLKIDKFFLISQGEIVSGENKKILRVTNG